MVDSIIVNCLPMRDKVKFIQATDCQYRALFTDYYKTRLLRGSEKIVQFFFHPTEVVWRCFVLEHGALTHLVKMDYREDDRVGEQIIFTMSVRYGSL